MLGDVCGAGVTVLTTVRFMTGGQRASRRRRWTATVRHLLEKVLDFVHNLVGVCVCVCV